MLPKATLGRCLCEFFWLFYPIEHEAKGLSGAFKRAQCATSRRAGDKQQRARSERVRHISALAEVFRLEWPNLCYAQLSKAHAAAKAFVIMAKTAHGAIPPSSERAYRSAAPATCFYGPSMGLSLAEQIRFLLNSRHPPTAKHQ